MMCERVGEVDERTTLFGRIALSRRLIKAVIVQYEKTVKVAC